MDDGAITEVNIDTTADRLDEVVTSVAKGLVSGLEGVDVLVNEVALYIGFTTDTADLVDLLVGLGHDGAVRIAEHPDVSDPVLVEYYDARVDGVVLGPAIRARLDHLVDDFRSRHERHDQDVAYELTEVCRHGMWSHRLLMSSPPTATALVALAHELRIPEALAAAVMPTSGNSHIANQYRSTDDYHLALDLLAHLACDPDIEMSWRGVQALLDVAAHVETCSDAIVRLPIHRLTGDQTERLLSIHKDRVELFNEIDSVVVPLSLDLLRDNRIVRSALWQAYDARQL